MDADVDLTTDGPRFHQGRRAGGTKPKIWQALWSSAGKMARQVADVYLCAGNVSLIQAAKHEPKNDRSVSGGGKAAVQSVVLYCVIVS